MTRVLLLVVLALAGCTDHAKVCEPVTIVATTFNEETGAPDWWTVVEFPGGERRGRYMRWGAVGDTFCARRHDGGWR